MDHYSFQLPPLPAAYSNVREIAIVVPPFFWNHVPHDPSIGTAPRSPSVNPPPASDSNVPNRLFDLHPSSNENQPVLVYEKEFPHQNQSLSFFFLPPLDFKRVEPLNNPACFNSLLFCKSASRFASFSIRSRSFLFAFLPCVFARRALAS